MHNVVNIYLNKVQGDEHWKNHNIFQKSININDYQERITMFIKNHNIYQVSMNIKNHKNIKILISQYNTALLLSPILIYIIISCWQIFKTDIFITVLPLLIQD